MGTYKEVEGDLIKLALSGSFDVIGHGCNCFCRQKRGLAPQMVVAFGTNKFPLESNDYEGDINKLGQIDYQSGKVLNGKFNWAKSNNTFDECLVVTNCYTQYQWSTETKPFDYEAFTLCMRKMNHLFKGKHIGLPKIGSHLAGGSWEIIKEIIKKELSLCNVIIVIFNEN